MTCVKLTTLNHEYVDCCGWYFSLIDPLWKLLTKVGVLYCMEPIFTVIFVTNMSTVWEKVMTTLRAQVFRRILIQKVHHLLLLGALLCITVAFHIVARCYNIFVFP